MATARNEGPYFIEWLAYHKSIGVEEFVIYSNNNTDHSDELLGALADAGEITWVNNVTADGRRAQMQAYGHGFGILPDLLDSRWTLVIDLDEFFVFDRERFGSIVDFISWHEARPVDVITLSWLIFTSAGLQKWEDRPVIERFTTRTQAPDVHNKSMTRSRKAIQSRPHNPMLDPLDLNIIRNASGDLFPSNVVFAAKSEHPEATTAWVNHYLLRSVEEFIFKYARNRGDELVRDVSPLHMDLTMMDSFIQNHTSSQHVQDRRILECAGGLAAEYDRLLSLTGVKPALTRVQQHAREETQRLVEIVRTHALFQEPGTIHARFAALLT